MDVVKKLGVVKLADAELENINARHTKDVPNIVVVIVVIVARPTEDAVNLGIDNFLIILYIMRRTRHTRKRHTRRKHKRKRTRHSRRTRHRRSRRTRHRGGTRHVGALPVAGFLVGGGIKSRYHHPWWCQTQHTVFPIYPPGKAFQKYSTQRQKTSTWTK